MRAAVISDSHIFCRRSRWREHLAVMHDAADTAELFVFNGDTFDFKWRDCQSMAVSAARAILFLEDFAAAHPGCRLHVNLGNHDHAHHFIESLGTLARRTGNLTWASDYLRIGQALFLHGDVAIRPMNAEDLRRYRARWLHRKRAGEFRNRIYDAAFQTGAHVAVSRLAFPQRSTLRRISAYLEAIGHTAGTGLRKVCFGHTHVPMDGCHFNGIDWYNSGSMLAGMPFSPVFIEI
jgi:UDP-2,3-diacylglucosamine pyrophosphatase LpxH